MVHFDAGGVEVGTQQLERGRQFVLDDCSDGSSRGQRAMSCDMQYGAAIDYEPCDEQPETCAFNIRSRWPPAATTPAPCSCCGDLSFGDGIRMCDQM